LDKPKIALTELLRDGNAFHLLGTARRAAEQAGWTQDAIRELIDEMTSGDYAYLLRTINDRFTVE